MEFIEKLLIFVVFLCPIVFFHELGHFLFARLFGVRVEVFSVGFGKKIFKWTKGGTEYAISIIPLGGYVKMFGDDPLSKDSISEEEKKFAFTHKGKWARFWIVFGGPLANFLMAFCIFFGLFFFGEKVPEVQVGVLEKTSVFYEKGLRSADRVVAINEREVINLADFSLDGDKVKSITVERNGVNQKVKLDLPFTTFMQEFSTLSRLFRAPVFTDVTGKKFLLSLKEKEYQSDISLETLANSGNTDFFLVPLKDGQDDNLTNESFNFDKKEKIKLSSVNSVEAFYSSLRSRGLYSVDISIASIVMASPADKASLKQNDIILSLNSKPIYRFDELRNKIQEIGKKGEKANLLILRDKKEQNVTLVPELKQQGKDSFYAVGVYSSGIFVPLQYIDRQPMGFIGSISSGVSRTLRTIKNTFEGFRKLIASEASVKNIGGPIAIGKVATDSFRISLSYFFSIMALISVNLGVINLFPIPVLDGGHIMFIIFEIINRGPLSQRKMEIAQQFGVSLLFILIFVAIFNDLSRLFF